MRKIAGPEPTGVMDLGEEDFLGRPVQAAPAFDLTLQGAKLTVGEAAWEAAL
jgi:hypothetical protein